MSAWGNLLTGEQYTSNPLTITVDEDLNLVPIFRRIEYRLTLNTQGSGSVSLENLEAGQSGTGPFFGAGTRIRLTPPPEQGHIFQYWNTNLADTTAIKEVTVDGNLNLPLILITNSLKNWWVAGISIWGVHPVRPILTV